MYVRKKIKKKIDRFSFLSSVHIKIKIFDFCKTRWICQGFFFYLKEITFESFSSFEQFFLQLSNQALELASTTKKITLKPKTFCSSLKFLIFFESLNKTFHLIKFFFFTRNPQTKQKQKTHIFTFIVIWVILSLFETVSYQ